MILNISKWQSTWGNEHPKLIHTMVIWLSNKKKAIYAAHKALDSLSVLELYVFFLFLGKTPFLF